MLERTGKFLPGDCRGDGAGDVLRWRHFAQIERGRYLSIAADCAACHGDPEQKRPFAGGRAIETPFGKVLAPNITPDRETGIGS